jgi:uncharacterized repeat protein (TIGR03847 family)
MPVIDFDPPDRFVADSVGPAGQRTFFVQAVKGSQVMTVSLEKEQVRLLGESLVELLNEMAGAVADHPDEAELPDRAPLQNPIEEDFRARQLSLAWDEDTRRVNIEASDREPVDEDDDEPAEPDSADPIGFQGIRVSLPVGMARGFAARCEDSMTGGRPNCPFCGGPLDPTGHICPRANGYRR